MKNRKLIYTLLTIIIALSIYTYNLFTEDKTTNSTSTNEPVKVTGFNYLPTSTTNQIINHNHYALSYDKEHEQAEWVAYELKKEHLSYTNRKRPLFIQDDKVKTKSAHWGNYKKSGYTKGHLLPAGDRKFSNDAYNETFLTSNISPQGYDFNAGVWNRLEQKVRYWASKERHLYVVTGGVLSKGLKTIGTEKVSVPKYYYKVLLDYSEPEIKAVGFLVPHKDSERPLYEFVVPIDEIEAKTGIDFFPALADDLEEQLEKNADYKLWSF